MNIKIDLLSYPDGLVGLAGVADVMTSDAAVDVLILLELDQTNLTNKYK